MDIVEKARTYAADKHADKKRKYTDQPYFNHLEAVASTLQSAGVMEPTVLAAAYLHDTVEDTDAAMQDVIVEGSGLSEHALFKRAWAATTV
jgi:(p)ppGpp synthase/HD superfamily hydrolase